MTPFLKRTGAPIALAALAAAWAVPAEAADKLSVGIEGYMTQYFGYADNDDNGGTTDYTGFDVKSDAEIGFVGDTTLDNGLQFGLEVVLNGNTDSGEQLKDSYSWAEAEFGRFELGKRDNAAAQMHYSAPDVGLGINDADIDDWIDNPTGGDSDSAFKSTFLFLGEDKGTKLTYYTPRFMDLQVGVSYIPEFERDSNAQPAGDLYHDGFAVGVNYVRDFGEETSLALAAGFLTASAPDNSSADEAEGYSFGFEISHAGFTVGGSYASTDGNAAQGTDTATSLDGHGFDIGVSYAFDPVTVSLSYYSGEFEDQVAVAGESENDTVMLSANYEIGPGVSLLGTLFHSEFKDETGTENEGTAALVGMTLEF
ncbi:porin [Nisaea acidiphila]|uniref:Porin n=1 Tax=Nisaea acidiphila TaxID=1862145 RepID=A0A9J7ANL3_9PROT|nr:porin [Nisaea acidiphila]UUX48185.1 porin [Nisaea acidiphila]